MAHAFDTALPRPQRTTIRTGAVALLAGLKRPAGYLQAVIPWGGVLRGYTDDEGIDLLWKALQGRAPAIAVALGDRTNAPAGMGGFNSKGALELLVYFYSNHPRDMEAGRLSPDVVALASNVADPGLDVMLEHAEEVLVGQRVGASATIKQIRLTREEELRTDSGFSLWVQRYAVEVTRTINPHRGLAQMLEELRTVLRPTGVDADVEPDPAHPGERVIDLQNTTANTPP